MTSSIKDLQFKAQALVNQLNTRYATEIQVNDFVSGHRGRIATWEGTIARLHEYEKALAERELLDYQMKLDDALAKVEEAQAIEEFQGKTITIEDVATPDEELIAAFVKKIYNDCHQNTVCQGFAKLTPRMPRQTKRQGSRFLKSLCLSPVK